MENNKNAEKSSFFFLVEMKFFKIFWKKSYQLVEMKCTINA